MPPPPCILVGASTGGVEALHHLLAALPADLPPVLVVQHMRPGFLKSLVDGLARNSALVPAIASDHQPARAGHVYFAPDGDRHLLLDHGLVCRLVAGPPMNGHCPSVDALFLSGLRLSPLPLAVLLTGMGRDGAEGMRALHDAGATTIAQDRESSVVWGMPRAAVELGAASHCLPLDRIAAGILRLGAGQGPRLGAA